MIDQDQKQDLFTTSMEDSEVRRHFEREWFVDEVLSSLESVMRSQGISRSELARRLKCSGANVTKLFRRGTNLTVGSMVDLALAVGHRIRAPELEPLTTQPPWLESRTVVLNPMHVWINASVTVISEAEVPTSPAFSWPTDHGAEGEAGTEADIFLH